MSETAKRDDPELWDKVKEEVTAGDKGGKKDADNSLAQWTEEDWGTKSGEKSGETGERYLPRDAREALSDEDYARTSAKKRRDSKKGKQFSAQPEDVAEKTAPYRHGGKDPTKSELMAEARKRDIPGRSKMNKAELAKALK